LPVRASGQYEPDGRTADDDDGRDGKITVGWR
jgi:hypothetical protein